MNHDSGGGPGMSRNLDEGKNVVLKNRNKRNNTYSSEKSTSVLAVSIIRLREVSEIVYLKMCTFK